ncbi:hypothetical protein N7530_000793 [Penicillium desertorum]|uniref:Uncharacterized protein n=1 Tax=Penicillium desertorum TaxID=1303715 RepID=A0A9X0BVQ0_9EURO|nr:hypothetical protein N7530_000793 [Penicillium desertorum]
MPNHRSASTPPTTLRGSNRRTVPSYQMKMSISRLSISPPPSAPGCTPIGFDRNGHIRASRTPEDPAP